MVSYFLQPTVDLNGPSLWKTDQNMQMMVLNVVKVSPRVKMDLSKKKGYCIKDQI